MTKLNEHDGWEKIVNRKTARRRAKKEQGIGSMAAALFFFCLVFLVLLGLWLFDIVDSLWSIMWIQIIGCAAGFLGGRLWEMAKG